MPEGKAYRVANTQAAIADWPASPEPHILVVFEATSGCDRGLLAALPAAKSPMSG